LISDEQVRSLNEVSSVLGVSPFVVCISAYYLLLHRYSGQKDIAIGTPTAGRDNTFSGIFNYFVNPVIVRSKIDETLTVEDYIRYVSDKVNSAFVNQQYPLPLISEKLPTNRSSSQSQLFQTTFVWENINSFENREDPLVNLGGNGDVLWDLHGAGVWKRFHVRQQLDNFDLTFKMYKFGASYMLGVEYNADIFSPERISRMTSHD